MSITKPEEEGMAYEAALDLLAQPHGPREMLARALQLANDADELHQKIAEDRHIPPVRERFTAQQRSALDVAATLAQIADVAVALAREEREANPPTIVNEVDDGPVHPADGTEPGAADDGPHALACRFTADFEADSIGRVGGRELVFVRHIGWLDVTHLPRAVAPNTPGRVQVRARGRAVSRYNDRVLVITDQGNGMALPAALVTIEEDR